MTDSEQYTRRKHLRELAETHHRGSHGDYEDAYEEFAATYLGSPEMEEDHLVGTQPVPKYAAVAHDETYGMIHVCDTLDEALVHQATTPDNGEYLNVPGGIYDLDTGKLIETRTVTLPLEVFRAMCGVVAMSYEGDEVDVLNGGEGVNHHGIFTDWELIRKLFPIDEFRLWARQHGETGVESEGVGYLRDFGE